MKVRLSALALCALLLAGCRQVEEESASLPPEPVPQTAQELLEGQTIDDTHDAFLVDTGGRLGTLLVTVEQYQDGYERYGLFEVWNPHNMAQPIQREIKPLDLVGSHLTEDANFDGYGDLGYLYAMGNQPNYWYFWLWDEEQGRFIEEPAFADISEPVFDQEKQLVYGWARSSGASTGLNTTHRWIDGKLICVRRIETELDASTGFESVFLSVEDWIDGTQVEMFYQTYDAEDGSWFEKRDKWKEDLDYRGEPGDVYDQISGWLDGRWSHVFTVDTGGSLGVVLVTAERGISDEGTALCVWDMSDLSQPIQTLHAHIVQPEDALGSWRCRADANFDGYGDLGYLWAFHGDDHTGFYNFWCWDEGARQFVMVDGFEDLELMWFDPDTKTVYGRLEGYFQRENEKFTLYEEQN